MARKTLLSLALVVVAHAASASEPATPSTQEQAMLQQLRDTAKRQGMTMTPEMEAMALQRMREMQANMLGLQAAAQGMRQSPPVAATAPAPSAMPAAMPNASRAPMPVSPPAVSSSQAAEWQSAIARHKTHARRTSFEDSRDGFLADGRPWLDPEGEIEWYGADRATGNVTYLVRQGPGDYVVRFANVNAPDAPVTMGRVRAANNRESYTGVDGVQLSGEQIIPLADGVIATRGSVFFRYEFGSAPTSHTIPSEYGILYAQRGDVVGTGYILAVKKARMTFGDRFLSASGTPPPKAPAILGRRDPDFALVDTRSGNLVVIPRSEATTDIPWKARYRPGTGERNPLHFFNAIDWQQTSIGPIAIVFGDNSASIYAVQLNTGKQVTLFKRGMGINDWRASATQDDGLRVEAQLGFERASVEDVRTSFGANP